LPPALAGGMKIENYLMALAKRYIWLKPFDLQFNIPPAKAGGN
jgi:hypothetical protein